LAVGCSQSHPPVDASAEQIPERHYEPRVTPSEAPAQAPSGPTATGEPDDASLLARKTSDYARNVSPLLPGAAAATQPSMVQWDQPAIKPPDEQSIPRASQHATSNQGATLAAVHFNQDSSVPQILPESADFSDNSSNGSAGATATSAPPGSTDELEQKLQKEVQDYPRDLGSQFDYQLLRLVRDEPTPDLSSVAQLSPEDRDLLLALMDGLSNFRNASREDGNIMLNRKIRPLLEMADRLRSQAQLAIPTVAFCSQVVSYGVYTPMPSSRFPAGRNNDLIVYNEVANFTSIQGSDSIWRTRLQQEMVLYTDTGMAVWPDKSNSDTFVDESRNRRHDFFISRLVRLPSSLAAGKYVLKVTLTDEQSNRVVEASAPLEIAGDSETAPVAQPASDQSAGTPDVLSP
jgi:hypothetical protein